MVIRPSSLPSFRDCARRQASRMFPVEIADAGFRLRRIEPTIGAPVGSGTHAAIGVAMAAKLETGELPKNSDCEEAGIAELGRRISEEGVVWDQTTPNLNTAQKQVQRQYRIFRLHLAERITPQAVERRIIVKTRRGNDLSGQPDFADDGVRDWKTGTTQRCNIAQLGGYSMLRRSEGFKVARVVEDYIKRVPLEKEQPAPTTTEFDVQLAERVAASIIGDIEDKYAEFMETGDPMVFPANPASVLCSDRFCPSWGTEWCTEHLG